jgi:hypothetical protein
MFVALSILLTAATIAAGFFAGYWAGKGGQSGDLGRTDVRIGPGQQTCSSFCTAWQISRADVCSAVTALQSAQAVADACAKSAAALALAATAAAASLARRWSLHPSPQRQPPLSRRQWRPAQPLP